MGQGHVTATLRNALLTDQLAHAYLFCGPRGVGKTTCARILARAVNAEQLAEDGDLRPEDAQKFEDEQDQSLHIFELDAASNNSVDDIRTLIERLRYIPQGGKRSVYIIDEVHMLSTAAFNAFLKTLEEPPAHALFILATTEKHKILPTILSRCQKFDFRRVGVQDIADHLAHICGEEEITYEPEALHLIAQKADGALRDALSIFDQLVNTSNRNLTLASVQENLNVLDQDIFIQLSEHFLNEDHAQALMLFNDIIINGFEPNAFLNGLVEYLRDLLVIRSNATESLVEKTTGQKQALVAVAKRYEPALLVNALNLCAELELRLRQTRQPRLQVELLLVKLCHLRSVIQTAAGAASKKKVAEAKHTPNPAAGSAAQPASDTPNAAGGAGAPPPNKPTAKRNKQKVKIPLSASDLDAVALPSQQAEAAVDYDAFEGEKQPIDTAAFQQHLPTLLDTLSENPTAQTAFATDHFRIEANYWYVKCGNQLTYNRMQQVRGQLQGKLRELLRNPSAIIRVEVDESLAEAEEDSRTLKREEILQKLSAENPHLQQFIEQFEARIDYQ